MKIVIRELIRCAALVYLLGAPWALVSSRVEGLAAILLLAGILPAGSFLLSVLKHEMEVQTPSALLLEPVDPRAPEPISHPHLRLVSEGPNYSSRPRS